jgi:hypothetical protein
MEFTQKNTFRNSSAADELLHLWYMTGCICGRRNSSMAYKKQDLEIYFEILKKGVIHS